MAFNQLFTLLFGGTFGLVGAVFFCVGLGFFSRRHKRGLLCSAVADGQIVALTPQRILSYRVGELVYEKTCAPSSRAHALGEAMRVHYDPGDPGNCYIEGELRSENVFIYVFGGLGLLFMLIAIITALILL